MKLPTKDRTWIREVENALSRADEKSLRNGDDETLLYKAAPAMVARKRGIKKPAVVEILERLADTRVQRDWGYDKDSKGQYLFHFVSTYVFSHVDAGLISEKEGDRLMLLLTQNLDIFID